MGLYLNTDAGDQLPLASNSGWSEMGAWIESLDGASQLSRLWEHGWAEPAGEIADELQAQIKATAPHGDTGKTAAELLRSLRLIDADAAVVVSDGMEE